MFDRLPARYMAKICANLHDIAQARGRDGFLCFVNMSLSASLAVSRVGWGFAVNRKHAA